MTDGFRYAHWFKSSHSHEEDACVEVAFLQRGRVAVRDSKNPDAAALVFTSGEWDAFLKGAVDGEFGRP